MQHFGGKCAKRVDKMIFGCIIVIDKFTSGERPALHGFVKKIWENDKKCII